MARHPSAALPMAILLGMGLLAGPAPGAVPGTGPSQPGDGESLFRAKCSPCHTIGGGPLVGPDLSGVTGRRDRDWLARFISAPSRVFASGDPAGAALLARYKVRMPDLRLTAPQVSALIGFLGTTGAGRGPEGAAPPAGPPLPAGNARTGRALFAGEAPLGNGGAPCISCHTVSGVGYYGGGSLGPDLTGAYAKFGDAGLAAVLASLPFPTMKPIFDTRPLTPGERSDLEAFFRESATLAPARAAGRVHGTAGAGLVVLFLLAGAAWRRRLVAVRRPLVGRSRGAEGTGA